MVYKKTAFVAGQMQIVINVGKCAKKMLDTSAYSGNVEKAEIERQVKLGIDIEKDLDKYRKIHGL